MDSASEYVKKLMKWQEKLKSRIVPKLEEIVPGMIIEIECSPDVVGGQEGYVAVHEILSEPKQDSSGIYVEGIDYSTDPSTLMTVITGEKHASQVEKLYLADMGIIPRKFPNGKEEYSETYFCQRWYMKGSSQPKPEN